MLKTEFEALAGYEVSNEDYTNIIEPMYMATELSKQEFVKTINKKMFAKKHENKKVLVAVDTMPNGTLMTYEAEVIDVDIKNGITKVRRLGRNRVWAETNADLWAWQVKEVA